MSKLFVHKYKHSHAIRKAKLLAMVKLGRAQIVEKGHDYLIFETSVKYRISNRGRLIRVKGVGGGQVQ